MRRLEPFPELGSDGTRRSGSSKGYRRTPLRQDNCRALRSRSSQILFNVDTRYHWYTTGKVLRRRGRRLSSRNNRWPLHAVTLSTERALTHFTHMIDVHYSTSAASQYRRCNQLKVLNFVFVSCGAPLTTIHCAGALLKTHEIIFSSRLLVED